MPYSAEVMRRARQRLASAKADKESVYQEHLHSAYEKVPRLRQIDMLLRKSMALAAQAVFTKGGDAVSAMEQVKNANLTLQQERQELIERNFEKGYLDDNPICVHCGGNGYVGTAVCRCLAELCRQEQRQELALLTTGEEQFSAFRLDYYSDHTDRKYGASPRTIMEGNLRICQRYAAGFDGSGNLLFVGNTGLGKTFMCNCIAKSLLDKGHLVIYQTAFKMFEIIEEYKFKNADNHLSKSNYENLFDCDLLIIDDLGTELTNSFTNSELFNILNTRLLSGKKTIISTNLSPMQLGSNYAQRIFSRIFDRFKMVKFVGKDLRWENKK